MFPCDCIPMTVNFNQHIGLPVNLLPPSLYPSNITLLPLNMSISCLRCTDFCLQCSVYSSLPLRKKYLCHQCESAGLDCCLFPLAIHLVNSQSNSRCISCIEHHKKCIFFKATDSQCTRTLNGKYFLGRSISMSSPSQV